MVTSSNYDPRSQASLTIPPSCQWAIDKLFIYQRSEAAKRKPAHASGIDAATVSGVVREVYMTFAAFLPPPPPLGARPGQSPPMRILDIGAGLAMYHVHLARRYQGTVLHHYLCDRSANEVPGSNRI